MHVEWKTCTSGKPQSKLKHRSRFYSCIFSGKNETTVPRHLQSRVVFRKRGCHYVVNMTLSQFFGNWGLSFCQLFVVLFQLFGIGLYLVLNIGTFKRYFNLDMSNALRYNLQALFDMWLHKDPQVFPPGPQFLVSSRCCISALGLLERYLPWDYVAAIYEKSLLNIKKYLVHVLICTMFLLNMQGMKMLKFALPPKFGYANF